MGATVFLPEAHIAVEPGEDAVCEVRLRNSGDIVDQFELDVVGGVADWTVVEPPLVNLLPGDEVTARVLFRPPRTSATPAGPIPFAVRVQSREDPYGSVVEEGVVELARFTDIVAELVPAKRRGRRQARYRLAIDNNGNHEVGVEITAIDENDALEITVGQPVLNIVPGTAALIRTTVAPTRRFLKGEAKSHPFQLVTQPVTVEEPPEPIVTEGVMIQEQLVPKWLLAAAVVALAGTVAMFVLWFTLLKPTVQSTAREEARHEVANATEAALQANKAAAAANEAAKAAADGKSGPGGGDAADEKAKNAADATNGEQAKRNGEAGTNPITGPDGRAPTVFRLQAAADPVTDGSFQSFALTAPDKQALEITDIVLQNPRGDSGFLRLLIDGDVVLEVGLDNFRDLDYHYVVPLAVPPEKPVAVLVNCVKSGARSDQCTPSASFSGWLRKP